MLKFHRQFVGVDDLVFDIGANIGTYSAMFAKLKARTIALEPHPGCVEGLRGKFAGHDLVTIVPKGVGDREGELLFTVNNETSTHSTFSESYREDSRYRDEKWGEQIPVEVTTLDALIAEYGIPDYCKIDVEGFEKQVIEGLSRPIPLLSLEFHSEFPEDIEYCTEQLESMGECRYRYSRGHEFNLVPEQWISRDEILEEIKGLKPIGDTGAAGDIYVKMGANS